MLLIWSPETFCELNDFMGLGFTVEEVEVPCRCNMWQLLRLASQEEPEAPPPKIDLKDRGKSIIHILIFVLFGHACVQQEPEEPAADATDGIPDWVHEAFAHLDFEARLGSEL